ncbi:MAG: Smr/MutS family protein [Bacilli bacterium]|nr:Smr/MutS family protein [Bacilli bacterium]
MAIVTSKTPTLDLHGEIESMVEVLVLEFINDNVKMRNEVVLIVHGKSTNILTKEVHRVLKSNKNVKAFKLDNWNLGQTIVELKI